MSKLIVVDPGHGGQDHGGSSLGPPEKEVALDYALMLGLSLQRRGYRIMLTRTDDRFVPLSERANKANEAAADLFVSVHANASGNEKARGPWTLHAVGAKRAKEIGASLQKAMVEVLGGKADAVYPDGEGWTGGRRLAVLRQTRMPAVLLELGFLTNQQDMELITNPDVRKRVCEAVASAIHWELGGWEDPVIPDHLEPIPKKPVQPELVLDKIVIPRKSHVDEIVRRRGIRPEAARAGLEVAEVLVRAVAAGQTFDVRRQITKAVADALADWIKARSSPRPEK